MGAPNVTKAKEASETIEQQKEFDDEMNFQVATLNTKEKRSRMII